MIQKIAYKNIDFKKYDSCLDATNAPIYAYSWYLDVVTKKHWNVLVWKDYEVVMPIPYGRSRKTFFLKRVIQPLFCQQLGVFGKGITQEIFDDFWEYFLKLKPFRYSFCHENSAFVSGKERLIEKPNYVLDLNNSYENIYQNYSKNVKRNLKKFEKSDAAITKNNGVDLFLKLKLNHSPHLTSMLVKEKLKNHIKKISKHGHFICAFLSTEIIAEILTLKTQNSIYHLFAAKSEKAANLGAAHAIVNHIIQENANSELTLDFEGSAIEGVARFYKSFGAANQPYFLYK